MYVFRSFPHRHRIPYIQKTGHGVLQENVSTRKIVEGPRLTGSKRRLAEQDHERCSKPPTEPEPPQQPLKKAETIDPPDSKPHSSAGLQKLSDRKTGSEADRAYLRHFRYVASAYSCCLHTPPPLWRLPGTMGSQVVSRGCEKNGDLRTGFFCFLCVALPDTPSLHQP